ncbi:MAG TPA: IS481 family transposase [Gemmatimonadales bacterium]|nr:IS481 family transposase [Gemmatimonadales bacterium]
MEQRHAFVDDYRQDLYAMTELCARYGISRKTGYKWLARVEADGRRGLLDRSRAPHACPHRIPAETAALLCAARRRHPDWGAGKLLAYLGPRYPTVDWPAVSTVNDLLDRHGLLTKRRRRRSHAHPGVVPPTTTAPNDLWTADFKGQFPTQDGRWCYPLTIADLHTRYLLTCTGLPSTHGAGARAGFERAFRTYGLPRAIRTDNGTPFAASGLHGLSRLNVWWMRLGIQHQRIHPGRPQENGAHERMHRTLKRAAIRPPRADAPAQQRAFNRFRQEYNSERPHAALGDTTPAAHYHPSPRPYPVRLPPQVYPGHYLVKKITTGGTFRFQSRLLFISRSLTDHHIGLAETDDGIWSIYFNTVLLGKLDERDYVIRG